MRTRSSTSPYGGRQQRGVTPSTRLMICVGQQAQRSIAERTSLVSGRVSDEPGSRKRAVELSEYRLGGQRGSVCMVSGRLAAAGTRILRRVSDGLRRRPAHDGSTCARRSDCPTRGPRQRWLGWRRRCCRSAAIRHATADAPHVEERRSELARQPRPACLDARCSL